MEIKFNNNASKVVELFAINGNPYHWTIEKWNKYYQEYPYSGAVSIAAFEADNAIGHYGLLPVRIGNYEALMGVHAYVKDGFRNLKIINTLLLEVYKYAEEHNYAFICGFSNHNFSKVLSAVFKWKVIGYLSFDTVDNLIIKDREKYLYKFNYTDEWYQWKFGQISDVYIKNYIKDGQTYNQLLKVKTKGIIDLSSKGKINFWNPDKYLSEYQEGWNQPFLIKPIMKDVEDTIYNIRNWYLEMGDSDTFEF